MLAYQVGMSKFEGSGTKVLGISEDNIPSQQAFAKQLNLGFPLLSDFAKREVAAEYGVLVPERGYANRATFVVDRDGKIVHIEEGTSALDPTGAETACSRMAHRGQ